MTQPPVIEDNLFLRISEKDVTNRLVKFKK